MSVPIPVITMRIEGMAMQIASALTQYEMDLSAEIQKGVAEACTPENIQKVVDNAVAVEMHRAITEEVERYFRYGGGRDRVRHSVMQLLERSE